ncbi:hypothetical protein KBX31_12165, partial [Liquorilactobacillus satsumensis]|uniref:hypothetical protein n=1 Tax=Liquorilactobacillus satsumensis TaxID=259059 RepID=UPI0021C4350B
KNKNNAVAVGSVLLGPFKGLFVSGQALLGLIKSHQLCWWILTLEDFWHSPPFLFWINVFHKSKFSV